MFWIVKLKGSKHRTSEYLFFFVILFGFFFLVLFFLGFFFFHVLKVTGHLCFIDCTKEFNKLGHKDLFERKLRYILEYRARNYGLILTLKISVFALYICNFFEEVKKLNIMLSSLFSGGF